MSVRLETAPAKAAARKATQRASKAAEKKVAKRAAEKAAERKAVRAARKAADQKAAEQARKAAEQKAAERGRKAAERKAAAKVAREATESHAARAGKPGPNFHAFAAFSMAATRGMTEMGSAWMDWLGGSSGAHAQLSKQLVRCRSMQELAHTQQSFFAGSAQGWMDHNKRVLQISRHAAEEGMRALGGRRPGPTVQ